MSYEKVELGRFLFYDTRMSGNQTFACASCHKQELAFTDGRALAVGSLGEEVGGLHLRSSMSLTNVGYNSTLTWQNLTLSRMEDQALTPMFGDNPIVELGLQNREQLLTRLRPDPRYQRFFAEAYPDEADPFTLDDVVKAIASFERTLISGNSPFDRYTFGIDDNALSASALRGRDRFFLDTFAFQCHHCHGGFDLAFSVHREGDLGPQIGFFNNALYNLPITINGVEGMGGYPAGNRGIFETTGVPTDLGKFRAPTLRNIAVTAPYMHDGSIATLDQVLDHYAAGGRTITEGPNAGNGSLNPYKDGFIHGFRMSDQDKQDLLAFMESLTDDEFLTNPKFSDPFALDACAGDCDHDGGVDVNELIATVGVALHDQTLATCWPSDADGDGEVDISELTRAVRSALSGCPQP
jgi:cytochrome c peroxidase